MLIEDIHRLGGDIFKVLSGARHVGIVGHRDPDGDCMGSMLAWSGHFANDARPHVPFCVEGEIERWHFLPGSFRLERHREVWRTHDFDVLIFVDTPDVRYAGLESWLTEGKGARPYIINIDHHHDNELYGDVNLVIGDAPATAHIMYDLFVAHDVPIDRHIATCLLCGLLIDTHHFSNAATTGATLAVASDLVRRGANLPKLARYLWQREELSYLSVWGRMLTRLHRNMRYDIVSTVVPHEDIAGMDHEVEGMANFLNLIGEGKCAMIVKETEPGLLKGSFRTTRNDIDVSRLARVLGGGGHQKAAGFSLPGTLVETEAGWRVR